MLVKTMLLSLILVFFSLTVSANNSPIITLKNNSGNEIYLYITKDQAVQSMVPLGNTASYKLQTNSTDTYHIYITGTICANNGAIGPYGNISIVPGASGTTIKMNNNSPKIFTLSQDQSYIIIGRPVMQQNCQITY